MNYMCALHLNGATRNDVCHGTYWEGCTLMILNYGCYAFGGLVWLRGRFVPQWMIFPMVVQTILECIDSTTEVGRLFHATGNI